MQASVPRPPKPPSSRQARLAKALKANLLRRKAINPPTDKAPSGKEKA